MSKIFLLPGLGADGRIFNNLDLTGHDVTRVEWMEPTQFDTIRIYAQKLVDHYRIHDGATIIGNSLGGMIGTEIAKIIKPEKLILISSIKTVNEAPAYFKFFQEVPVYNLLPVKLLHSIDFVVEHFFGAVQSEDTRLFRDMLNSWPTDRLKWGMKAALQFENTVVPENTWHINGDKDMVFPYKMVKDAIVVKGGTHIMMYDMPAEINKILKKIFNDEITPVIATRT